MRGEARCVCVLGGIMGRGRVEKKQDCALGLEQDQRDR